MKLIAVSQRGACKDFIDLKFIMDNTGLNLEVLLQDLSRKYAVGEEIFFQIKKSLIYFDDAERDLNVNMYATDAVLEAFYGTRQYIQIFCTLERPLYNDATGQLSFSITVNYVEGNKSRYRL